MCQLTSKATADYFLLQREIEEIRGRLISEYLE